MDKPEKTFYSVTEAAALLNVSRRTIQRRIYGGELEYIKLGGKIQIPAEAIFQLIEDSRQPAPMQK